jgi:hypothetical protein
MANLFQFDDKQHGRSPLCIACEEMLADALDQTLSPADQAWFDRHVTSCVECSDMLADAQRGAAWLELLKSPRPEPSAALMERILAQTSGLQNETLSPIVIGQPSILPVSAPSMPHGNILSFRPRMPKFAGPSLGRWMNAYAQPRLAMTAAMAFFSVALTLNLTGVRLDQLHASDLNPSNVRRTYYQASADAVRYCDNLRVVRVMESRVDDLRVSSSDDRRSEDRTPAPALQQNPQQEPAQKPAPKPAQKDPNGPTSRIESPVFHPQFVTTAAAAQATDSNPAPAPTARSIPAQGNALGHTQAATKRAESPTYLVAQLVFDPRNNAGLPLKKFTQEGGLA